MLLPRGCLLFSVLLTLTFLLPGRSEPPVDKKPPPRLDRYGDPLPEGAIARLGSSRLRIGNSAFALAPDGQAILTVAPEGIVRKFDANLGRLLERRQLTDRSDVDPIGQSHAQLSADGKTAAIDEQSPGSKRVTVWEIPSGKMIFRHAPAEGMRIGAYALSPDGKQLAVYEYEYGRDVQKLRAYDLKTGRMKELGSLEFNVYNIDFTSDGKRVLVSQTSSSDATATFAFFDVPAGKQLWRLPRRGGGALSPDGKTIVSAVFGGQNGFHVIETNLDSGKPTEGFKPYGRAHPNVRVVIAPDDRTVVMNYFDEIVLWDLRTGEEIRRFALPKNSGGGYGPQMGAFSPDGRTMVTNLGHLQRWDLTTGKPLFDAPPDDSMGGPVERLAFTGDGKELFASSWSLSLARWEVATGKQIGLTRQRFGHQFIWIPDGLRVLTCDWYKTPYEVTVIDPVAGKPLRTVYWAAPQEVGINGVRAYTLTTNGKTLLVAHGDEPRAAAKSYVTACDVASGRRLARFTVPGDLYYARPPFSPCGRWVVLGGKVYHVTGTELFTPTAEPGECLLPNDRWAKGPVWFSDDGRLLAGKLLRKVGNEPATTDTLAVWELASGKILARFPNAGFVAQVAFAPDSRTLAFVNASGVYVHDLLHGKRLAAYAAPDVTCDVVDRGCGTQTLAFAPDGRTLATGHRDGTILLWKVPRPAADNLQGDEAELATLWADLGSDSPPKGRAAVEWLARTPATAVALLRAKFRPVPAPPDPAIAALVRDLDSDAFATREEATRKLREQGVKAEAALRQARAGKSSLEMKRRIDALLDTIPLPLVRLPVTGETLRSVRAIEVLERIGTPEAHQVLESFAQGAPEARLTQEAKASLERLAKRAAAKP